MMVYLALLIAFIAVFLAFYFIYVPFKNSMVKMSAKSINWVGGQLEDMFIFIPVDNLNTIKLVLMGLMGTAGFLFSLA